MSDYPSDENLRPKRQRTGEGGMPAAADEADTEVIFLSYISLSYPERQTEVMKAGYEEERCPDIPSEEEPENIKNEVAAGSGLSTGTKTFTRAAAWRQLTPRLITKSVRGIVSSLYDSSDTVRALVFYVKSRFGNYLLPLAQSR